MTHLQIYNLATQLFCEEEWPMIQKSLQTALPQHTRCIMNDDGSVGAFILVSEKYSKCAYIAYCGVNPQSQGKGLGTKLLKETLDSIFQVDYERCSLLVDRWNVGARRLYERFGFKWLRENVEPHVVSDYFELRAEDYRQLWVKESM